LLDEEGVMRDQASVTLAGALGVMLATTALATPVIQNGFKAICKPKPGTALFQAQCRDCHVVAGEKKLNPFGLDVQAELKKQHSTTFTSAMWQKLGPRDSDHDGASNSKEIAAGTLPGDPKSKP
jgi:hypothetical protein